MRVLVCGASGAIGGAVVQALRWRGHRVFEGVRRPVAARDAASAIAIDFMRPREPAAWASLLGELGVDAIVNAAGILMPSRDASFERVHAAGPIELFEGAALAGISRVVQVSALGVGRQTARETPYCASKRSADRALLGLGLDAAVVRPSLVYGPRSESARLFATLAALPVVSLPGRGRQCLQPLHVLELAEAITVLVESTGSSRGVYELGGADVVSYRAMLAAYRRAQGLGDAIWLAVPMPLMHLGARLAEALPQRVFCRDTMRMLAMGSVPTRNALPALLGRAPATLDEGLRATPPEPAFDLRVALPPVVAVGLRLALAFLWLQTALVSALWPHASGVLDLLARCGFAGTSGWVMLAWSCALNTALGVATLARPGVRLYALQALAVTGYTLVAAWNVPALTLDHCAPLAKNVPLLGLVLLLWLADASRARLTKAAPQARPAPQTSMLATRSALPSMKLRRGSTSSPISIVKTRSASIASSS